LLVSFGLQLARTCVPVRPGEDLPCPSVPQGQASDFPTYLTSPLKQSIENGAMVYSCADPAKLLVVDGGMTNVLAAGANIQCKPNSGMYVLDGKPVSSKKFLCGEGNYVILK
ncbi:hypothetical protein PENTCL1PPCAC_28021, partial [Pristionchus entomophagus]